MADHKHTDNPYAKFLGIVDKNVDENVPPDHYSLLGLERFDADDAKLGQAAKQQAARLHQLASGPERAKIQKLLGDVAVARRTLADPIQKREYDEQLRNPVLKPEAENIEESVGRSVSISVEASTSKSRPTSAKKPAASSQKALWSLVVTGGLLILIAVLGYSLIKRMSNSSQISRPVATEAQQARVLEQLVRTNQQTPPKEQAGKKREAEKQEAAKKAARKKRAERRAAARKQAEKKAAFKKRKAEAAKKKASQAETDSD